MAARWAHAAGLARGGALAGLGRRPIAPPPRDPHRPDEKRTAGGARFLGREVLPVQLTLRVSRYQPIRAPARKASHGLRRMAAASINQRIAQRVWGASWDDGSARPRRASAGWPTHGRGQVAPERPVAGRLRVPAELHAHSGPSRKLDGCRSGVARPSRRARAHGRGWTVKRWAGMAGTPRFRVVVLPPDPKPFALIVHRHELKNVDELVSQSPVERLDQPGDLGCSRYAGSRRPAPA